MNNPLYTEQSFLEMCRRSAVDEQLSAALAILWVLYTQRCCNQLKPSSCGCTKGDYMYSTFTLLKSCARGIQPVLLGD